MANANEKEPAEEGELDEDQLEQISGGEDAAGGDAPKPDKKEKR
jgi:bacteriocin-like protein